MQFHAIDPVGIKSIPPRRWAYGRFLLFGSAAVIGAVDGGGKGAIATVMALAMITGRPLLGEHVWRAGPVVIVSYEDDQNEWHRRIAAGCVHHGVDYEHALANIHFAVKPAGPISFAAMTAVGICFPDGADLVTGIKKLGAVLLIVDPFNLSHGLEDGNSNIQVAQVAGEMARIARDSDAALLLLHHLRKGSTGAADDLMGATSLRATFRSCRILARMTPETAEQLQIGRDARRYVRIAGSKENYAPPPDKATWFRLASIELGNATEEYPDGDNVAVATCWQPRPVFEGMDATTLRAVFDVLRRTVHSPNKQAKHTPWCGKPLIEIGDRNEREAVKIVGLWLDSGVLVKDTYYHSASKHTVDKVSLDDAKASEILAQVGAVEVPAE